MDKQITFSLISDELAQAGTKKKAFWKEMERIMPIGEWVEVIRPCHYYKGERGNKPYDLELTVRIFLLQNFYDLSEREAMNEVIDSRAFSDFCGVDSPNQVPNGDTIGNFRNILINNGIQEKIFFQVVEKLSKKGLILKRGTIVDSTLIATSASTKNKDKPSQIKNCQKAVGIMQKNQNIKNHPSEQKWNTFSQLLRELFGYRKTRYRGLRKQTAKLNIMFALANLYLADRKSLLI